MKQTEKPRRLVRQHIIFYIVCFLAACYFSSFLGRRVTLPQMPAVLPKMKFAIKRTAVPPTQKTNLHEILEEYASKTFNSCKNTCDENDSICSAKKEDQWSQLIYSSRLTYKRFLNESQYIFPFEKKYLSYPPVSDLDMLPDRGLSTILINGTRKRVVYCDVDDVIAGRVDLVDRRGVPRLKGGDVLWAWMKNGHYRHVAHVEDLRNGSYKISGRCIIPGKFKFLVAVIYPREYLRTVIHQTYLGVTRFIAGRFRRGNISEATICWSTPNIPGRPCICNFTSVNQQSFYCGRPLDTRLCTEEKPQWLGVSPTVTPGFFCGRLNCDDWDAVYALPLPRPINCTKEEEELVQRVTRPPTERVIQPVPMIKVRRAKENAGKQTDLPPCNETSFNIMWDTETRPTGYWNRSQWVSLQCRRPNLTSVWALSCLTNTHVRIFGDSNGVRLYYQLMLLTGCAVTTKNAWPKQSACIQSIYNVTISFTPLEYPLYLRAKWEARLPYGGVAKQIDSIPSYGKHVVIVHYYLHIVTSHFSAVYPRITAVRDALIRLLKRNSDALVAVRGPHVAYASWPDNHTVGGDSLGTFFLQMIKNVFKGMENKVIFLDGWEMSAALENGDLHPSDTVPFEMIRTLLSFICHETVA